MEWAIDYILEKYSGGRDIVILGDGYNMMKWRSIIQAKADISRTIEALNDNIDPQNEYLIICEDIYFDHREQFEHAGMREIGDYYHWTKYARTNGHLPIDIVYKGDVKIGYGSYFPYSKDIMKHIGSIGRFSSIANSVIIQGNHSMNRITTSSLYPMLSPNARNIVNQTPSDKDPLGTNRKVNIGNDVWIGANVFINASRCSSIGDGAIIGTASLVMEDVPPYAIVYGSPARVKKYRFSPEQIEILMSVKWWEWDKNELDKNIDLLMNPELFFETFKRR